MENKLTPDEIIEKVKEDKIDKEITFTEEEVKHANAVFEKLQLPIRLKKGDVQFAPQEFDIRGLSNKDIFQLFFKTQIATVAHLDDISKSFGDLLRLVITLLYKLGIENIGDALTDTIGKLEAERESTKIKN